MSGDANRGITLSSGLRGLKQVGVSEMVGLSWVDGRHLTFCRIYEVAFWKGKGQKYRITQLKWRNLTHLSLCTVVEFESKRKQECSLTSQSRES